MDHKSSSSTHQGWFARRRLARFHRKCDRLGIPSDVRQRLIRMAEQTGEKLVAPDWYAGRSTGTN